MRDRHVEFGDAAIVVVTFAEPDDLSAHRAHLELPFPLVADPGRDLYRRFGLERGSLRDVYGLGTIRLYLRLIRQGRRFRRPTEDTRQLGGDFVVDGVGRLAAAFRPSSPDDRPTVDELVSAVERARSGPVS